MTICFFLDLDLDLDFGVGSDLSCLLSFLVDFHLDDLTWDINLASCAASSRSARVATRFPVYAFVWAVVATELATETGRIEDAGRIEETGRRGGLKLSSSPGTDIFMFANRGLVTSSVTATARTAETSASIA